MDNVTIVEVRRRADQGVTRPFQCQCDNGKWYWVKGHDAGKLSLCYEWIAGRMAQDFGLPIPPFIQAVVPDEIVKYSMMEDIADLGSGIVFASEHVEAQEYALSNISDTPPELRRKLLVFDWWIQNNDRMLDDSGGNVNILWLPEAKEARIIDHNIAFDSSFSASKLKQRHVFKDDLNGCDEGFCLELEPIMKGIRRKLGDYIAELPDEWGEPASIMPEFSSERIQDILDRFQGVGDLFKENTI